jgi:hypothetical protein
MVSHAQDMVAFSCCVFDGGKQERQDMIAARERGWKGKFTKPGRVIRPGAIRINGKCPLTPLEVSILKLLWFPESSPFVVVSLARRFTGFLKVLGKCCYVFCVIAFVLIIVNAFLHPSLQVGLMLRGMGFTKNTSIFLASGIIYNAEKTMAPLLQMFPNLHTKVHICNLMLFIPSWSGLFL